ncbi:Ankyrin repeat-containing protein [Colletotrichum asianum]
MLFHQTWIRNSVTAAQVYCGHPAEAIISRSKSSLLKALDQQVSLDFCEVDAFGFPYMYHLIRWPEGLKMILSRYGKSILHSHDKGIVASALECALKWSAAICSAPWHGLCLATCLCGESVNILLQTDSECLARTIRRGSWGSAMLEASVRVRETVIDELVGRRQELKALGLRHMKPTEIDCFGLLGNDVLDRYTGDILKALDDKGIYIHPSLRTEVIHKRSGTSGSIYQHGWIGSDMRKKIPNAFYSRGFTEVDIPNSHGLVPLAMVQHLLHYKEWLVEHGANLATEISGRPVGFTTAHMLFCPEPFFFYLDPPSLEYTSGLLKSLRSHVSKSASLDTCECGCSKDGCHPYTVMWRVALGDWSVDQTTQASLKQTVNKIIGLCEDLETDWTFSRVEISILLRVCTFMALPVRHTCCCSWEERQYSNGLGHFSKFEWACRVCEQDEVKEIREEDTNELALLENLLVEFERKIDEMGCTLASFFETYWIDRMGQVLQEIQDRPLLDEENQGAERLGITLRVEEEDRPMPEDTSQLEYWFRRLDAIVA